MKFNIEALSARKQMSELQNAKIKVYYNRQCNHRVPFIPYRLPRNTLFDFTSMSLSWEKKNAIFAFWSILNVHTGRSTF